MTKQYICKLTFTNNFRVDNKYLWQELDAISVLRNYTILFWRRNQKSREPRNHSLATFSFQFPVSQFSKRLRKDKGVGMRSTAKLYFTATTSVTNSDVWNLKFWPIYPLSRGSQYNMPVHAGVQTDTCETRLTINTPLCNTVEQIGFKYGRSHKHHFQWEQKHQIHFPQV